MRRFLRKFQFWKRGYADYSLSEFVILLLVFCFLSYKSTMWIRELISRWYFFIDVRLWAKFLAHGVVWLLCVAVAGAMAIAIVARLRDLQRINALIKSTSCAKDKIPR